MPVNIKAFYVLDAVSTTLYIIYIHTVWYNHTYKNANSKNN